MAGDDADEFLDAFAKRFDVDLTEFRSYLHYNANEPPYTPTAWGVTADGSRIPDIPISIDDLVAASKAGRWIMDYPDHRLIDRGPWVRWLSVGILLALVLTGILVRVLF